MHTFRGGIRIGNSSRDAINYSWPFANAVFTEDALQFSIDFFFLKTTCILPYHDISCVSLEKGLFMQGIRIRHHTALMPEFLLFWTGKHHSFLEECRNHSIPVTP